MTMRTEEESLENQKSVIEELEKIKTEVVELSYNCEIATVDKYRIEELLDKHISKLKGE